MFKPDTRQLILNKGDEQFIFRYQNGTEGQLLDAIASQAADKKSHFDWFDAAVLSFRLTQSLMGEADKILSNDLYDSYESLKEEF